MRRDDETRFDWLLRWYGKRLLFWGVVSVVLIVVFLATFDAN